MNQFALGLSLPLLVLVPIYFARRMRASLGSLLWTPVLMFACALWAVAPDLPRLCGRQDLYHRLSQDPRMNVFFWHYSIDRTEADSPFYLALVIVVLLCVWFAAWRELYRAEREES